MTEIQIDKTKGCLEGLQIMLGIFSVAFFAFMLGMSVFHVDNYSDKELVQILETRRKNRIQEIEALRKANDDLEALEKDH